MSKISIFLLVSVAEQTGLNLILLETPEDMFSGVQAHIWAFVMRKPVFGVSGQVLFKPASSASETC